MAWRLADYVERGRIDCSRKGEITGEVWLRGMDAPIQLRLNGLPCPDLAGCVLEFKTPHEPKAFPAEMADGLDLEQTGQAGDITASRKCKVPTVSQEEFDARYRARMAIPVEWRNILYIEWYGQRNGRVVLELPAAEWQVDAPRWRMTEEDIQQRADDSARAVTGFMDQLAGAYESQNLFIHEREEAIDPEADDEHSWEKRLQANDARTDALMDALDQCENVDEVEQALNRIFADPPSGSPHDIGDPFEGDETMPEPATFQLEDHSEMWTWFRELMTRAEADLMQSKLLESPSTRECVTLGVKTRTIADLALNDEDGIEPGYFIALAKREIARCQTILAEMADDAEWRELLQSVAAVRDLLVQINGGLRGRP